MDNTATDPIEERRKWVEGWNKTMVDIWQGRIHLLDVEDTFALSHSPKHLNIKTDADGRFLAFELSHTFLEYGLWQDMGTGRNTAIGNTHKKAQDGWTNKRKPRRWFSTKYYRSTMRLKEFMAESIGKEFVGIFGKLEAEDYRKQTEYYKSKGLS
ncbi:MAG: hypothetical protein K2G13_01660 [Muribaculaceae bacterium]|nr:hypothetical protein [Muribaculaceae bacterium]